MAEEVGWLVCGKLCVAVSIVENRKFREEQVIILLVKQNLVCLRRSSFTCSVMAVKAQVKFAVGGATLHFFDLSPACAMTLANSEHFLDS
jgi:hypothetical protein